MSVLATYAKIGFSKTVLAKKIVFVDLVMKAFGFS